MKLTEKEQHDIKLLIRKLSTVQTDLVLCRNHDDVERAMVRLDEIAAEAKILFNENKFNENKRENIINS